MWNIFLFGLTNNWWLYATFVACAGSIICVWLYSKRQTQKAVPVKCENTEACETKKLAGIVSGLGGVDNIYELDNCATRLRVVVNDSRLVDRDILRKTGARGILGKNRGIQIIYGLNAERINIQLKKYVDKLKEADNDSAEEILVSDEQIIERIYAPVEGDIVYLADIHGYEANGNENRDGIAIFPKRGEIRAPFDGEIRSSSQAGSKLVIKSSKGITILISIGRDLSGLGGEGIKLYVSEGSHVRKGSLLAEFDMDLITGRGFETTIYVIFAPLKEGYGYQAYIRENVNYEHIAMVVFEE